MGFTGDNLKGFILALLSSVFIGASFIIKKKGLRRAAAVSGVRAGNNLKVCYGYSQRYDFFSIWALIVLWWNLLGVGGYAYLMEPLWWLGMMTSESEFPLLCLLISCFIIFPSLCYVCL